MALPSLMAGPKGTDIDHRDPLERIARLLDPRSTQVVTHHDNVVVARGTVDGAPVVVYCTDATSGGGTIGVDECSHIVEAVATAVRERCPVVGIWHTGGTKLAEGAAAMDGMGRVFAAIARASGEVLQLSVVLGPVIGGAAYGPALTDLVIMAEDGRLFVNGPDVVRSVTGEEIDMETLGGPEAHSRKSGVAHLTSGSEDEAFLDARRVLALFAEPGLFDLGGPGLDEPLGFALPTSPARAYDMHPLLEGVLDDGFLELQAKWAPNMVIGLGRLGGRTVGVVANNPLRKGGCLDLLATKKASRFVRTCDALGVPLVVVVDVAGYLPGVAQEWNGVVRGGAELLHAFADAVVPRVTLVVRKSYGGASIAMNSRSLGATAVLAWPDAEPTAMGAEAAVEVPHRTRLATVPKRESLLAALSAEHELRAGGASGGHDSAVVDEVVHPDKTRRRLVEILAAPAGRGHRSDIPL